MTPLIDAVARIGAEVHPARTEAICAALESGRHTDALEAVRSGLGASFSPVLLHMFAEALRASGPVTIPEVAAMFRASSATAALVAGNGSVELVWTGPSTGMVPVRHTAQVLVGLIDDARECLFLVSFVAYRVDNVINALQRAADRRVAISTLLERSEEHGGNVSVDSVAMLKRAVPQALLYEWDKSAGEGTQTASVHAKCAVADANVAFVTSANLSDAGMERNMEMGVLLRGGNVPRLLQQHLNALVTTRQLRSI